MVSLPERSRRRMGGEERMWEIEAGEPMNLKVHSGGVRAAMCVKRAGRCGRGRVSTRKASFLGSKGDGAAVVVFWGGHVGCGAGAAEGQLGGIMEGQLGGAFVPISMVGIRHDSDDVLDLH